MIDSAGCWERAFCLSAVTSSVCAWLVHLRPQRPASQALHIPQRHGRSWCECLHGQRMNTADTGSRVSTCFRHMLFVRGCATLNTGGTPRPCLRLLLCTSSLTMKGSAIRVICVLSIWCNGHGEVLIPGSCYLCVVCGCGSGQ